MRNNDPVFRIRRDLQAEWVDVDTILDDGELGYAKDSRGLKIGNGITPWSALPWLINPSGGTDTVTSVNGRHGAVTLDKTDVGLGNVDNTADLDKPISTATQTALNGKYSRPTGNSVLYANDSGGAPTTMSYGQTATVNTLVQRGTNGVIVVGTPTATNHAATKAYVDSKTVSVPYDYAYLAVAPANTRSVGAGDNPLGIRVPRVFTLTGVHYRCSTADASGSMVVELRKNGVQIAGTALTIPSASQVAGMGATGLSVAMAVGDILTVQVTTTGTTPGKGLHADIAGTA